MIKYYYTAFGEVAKEPISVNNITNFNPFLYKGYYYDDCDGDKTKLFYCNSRYYSSELCRWISPDSIEHLNPQNINGLNLYAYCGNDSVNKYDPSGHIAITVAVGLPTAAYYAIIGILALCVVATVGYVESETHVISNTLESITSSIDETLDDIKDKIIEFATALVVKIDYNSFEKHHIVAKRDPRACFPIINIYNIFKYIFY